MKVENIKSNGISHFSPAQSSIPTIETAVSLYKMRFTSEEITNKFDQKSEYYLGRRYSDNHDVAIRIAAALTREAKKELKTDDEIILEGYIKSFVDSLSGTEMDQIIVDGLQCCASTDHWYEFEKEWD